MNLRCQRHKALGAYVKTFINNIEYYFQLSGVGSESESDSESDWKYGLVMDNADDACLLYRVDKDRLLRLIDRLFLRTFAGKEIPYVVAISDYIVGVMKNFGFTNYDFPVCDPEEYQLIDDEDTKELYLEYWIDQFPSRWDMRPFVDLTCRETSFGAITRVVKNLNTVEDAQFMILNFLF